MPKTDCLNTTWSKVLWPWWNASSQWWCTPRV